MFAADYFFPLYFYLLKYLRSALRLRFNNLFCSLFSGRLTGSFIDISTHSPVICTARIKIECLVYQRFCFMHCTAHFVGEIEITLSVESVVKHVVRGHVLGQVGVIVGYISS